MPLTASPALTAIATPGSAVVPLVTRPVIRQTPAGGACCAPSGLISAIASITTAASPVVRPDIYVVVIPSVRIRRLEAIGLVVIIPPHYCHTLPIPDPIPDIGQRSVLMTRVLVAA